MSRRAMAVVLVVSVLLLGLIVSARLNPVYQSRALVSVGPVAEKGSNSLEQNVALARGSKVRLAAQARHGSAATVHVGVVDGASLEFRARSRDAADAADVANAYAQAYVEVRRKQLLEEGVKGEGPERDRLRHRSAGPPPSVMVAARPTRSPLSPWPSEPWAVAGMALIALALALPNRESGE
jgi:hypothetical protein